MWICRTDSELIRQSHFELLVCVRQPSPMPINAAGEDVYQRNNHVDRQADPYANETQSHAQSVQDRTDQDPLQSVPNGSIVQVAIDEAPLMSGIHPYQRQRQ